jgi:hypothetical protein
MLRDNDKTSFKLQAEQGRFSLSCEDETGAPARKNLIPLLFYRFRSDDAQVVPANRGSVILRFTIIYNDLRFRIIKQL